MPKWYPQVRQKDGLFIAYAIHTNGKVEREGSYPDKVNAILSASDFSMMLNQYHRYAGKYKGTDKLIGRKIPQGEIDAQIKRASLALAEYNRAMAKKV